MRKGRVRDEFSLPRIDDDLEGTKGTVEGGISEHGDGKERRLSLAGGTQFANGRGHVMAGFDYVKIGGIGTQLTRDWGRRDVGLITNPNFATNGWVYVYYTTPSGGTHNRISRLTASGSNADVSTGAEVCSTRL